MFRRSLIVGSLLFPADSFSFFFPARFIGLTLAILSATVIGCVAFSLFKTLYRHTDHRNEQVQAMSSLRRFGAWSISRVSSIAAHPESDMETTRVLYKQPRNMASLEMDLNTYEVRCGGVEQPCVWLSDWTDIARG